MHQKAVYPFLAVLEGHVCETSAHWAYCCCACLGRCSGLVKTKAGFGCCSNPLSMQLPLAQRRQGDPAMNAFTRGLTAMNLCIIHGAVTVVWF
jgi:hypothetical protein